MCIRDRYGPDIISRFNLYTSMKVMVAPASGYTSGQALTALAEVAQENLPTGYTYELGGMAREEAQSSGSATGLIDVYKRQEESGAETDFSKTCY